MKTGFGFRCGAGSPTPPATTTLDPANTAASLTLSNGNLTITNNGAVSSISRSIANHSAGKYYMEVLVVSATQSYADGIGVMNASQSVNASLGVSANSGADFITGDGNFYINNSSQGSVASGATNGAIVGMAVDLDNGNIWFAVNGGLWNNSALANPVLNIGGISIASLGTPLYVGAYAQSGNTPASSITVNFGATAYTYTPPVGFGNW